MSQFTVGKIVAGIAIGISGLFLFVLLVIGYMAFSSGRNATDTIPTARPTGRVLPPTIRTATQGLGISRGEIQARFAHPELGWVSMESAPLADGTPRQLAKFDFGSATLEMIGPEENLTSVAVFVDDSMNGDADFFFNALYLSMVLNLVVPEWNRSSEWLAVNIGIADEGGRPVRYYDGMMITLRNYIATETIMVKVEVDSS